MESVAIMAALRDPEQGCPWDVAQTWRSLLRFTQEETHELIEAVEAGDVAGVREELGDLLLQVLFYAQIAREQGLFDLAQVSAGLNEKLLSRHPHVFPDGTLASFGQPASLTSAQVEAQWAERKAQEKAASRPSVMDGVPPSLPALARAQAMGKRAAKLGFDWSDMSGVRIKLDEELAELDAALASGDDAHAQEEWADAVLTLVSLARHRRWDSEALLRQGVRKFEGRMRALEQLALVSGQSLVQMTDAERDALWQRVKMQAGDE